VSAYEYGTECSETSAYKTQTPRNYPEESMQQDKQCTYNVTLRRVRVTVVPMEKQSVLHILCVCVCVALLSQHVKGLRLVILSSVACLTVPYFPHIIS